MNNLQKLSWLDWILIGFFSIVSVATIGLGLGYLRESNSIREQQIITSAVELTTQYELGKIDFEAGRYEIARQRFEYILVKQADYPGAMEFLTQTYLLMAQDEVGKTQEIPNPSKTPTPTLSPTPDTRAVEEIFESAQELLHKMEWRSLNQTLLALRDNDPFYRVSEVDSMLYLTHYFIGVDKILIDGDLEGGLYDLSLSELFAPLDSQTETYREWARLYQIGMSFWNVYPDRSVFYFSQLVAAAPYLKDLSGVAAITRYRMALILYGDALAQGEEWCAAVDQYNLAQGIHFDQALESKVREIDEKCQYSIATPTFTPTWTFTPSLTPSATTTGTTIIWTATLLSSNTATISPTISPTATGTSGDSTPTESTPTPIPTTSTTTPSPTGTPSSPTATASSTMTHTPTATETPTESFPSQTPTNTANPAP